MKKKLILLLCLALVMALTFGACGGGTEEPAAEEPSEEGAAPVADDRTWVIKAADGNPEGHVFNVHANKVFFDLVEEATEGRVTFEHYPAGQLGKQADMLDLLKTGVADYAIIGPSYMSGILPLSSAMELPNAYPDAVVASMAMLELAQNGALYEYEFSKQEIMPVVGIAYSPYLVFNNVKPIETIDDMKGLKIRGSGLGMELSTQAIGATLVNIVPQEMYEAALRGTVDALALSMESLDSYKVQEVVKYGTTGMSLTGWAAVYAFSDRVWNDFPEDIQEIIIDCGKQASLNFGTYIRDSTETYQAQYISEGMEVNQLSEEQAQTFDEALSVVEDKWIEEITSRGYDCAQTILDAVAAEVDAQNAIYNK